MSNFTETLWIISILLLFSSAFIMLIWIFYYPLVWIWLMLFITWVLIAIYALCEAYKQSNKINKIIKEIKK